MGYIPCGERDTLPSRKLSPAASHKTLFAASAQEDAFAKRKRRGAGHCALLWGGGGENPPDLNGRPNKKSKLKIRVRPFLQNMRYIAILQRYVVFFEGAYSAALELP